jgi:hypothetical protein
MVRQLRVILWFPLALLLAAFQAIPAEICQQIIRTAMSATDSICEGLGRNEACYGNHLLYARPQPGLPDFKFDQLGDIIDITGLETLRLSAMDLETGTWGIALMRMQANIPNRLTSRNVTMVLFGDVEVRNRVRSPHIIAVRPLLDANVNIRRYPDPEAYVMYTLAPNRIAIADGRTDDGAWLHVRILETGDTGWVSARTVDIIGNPDPLRIVDALSADFGPMQAFYLDTGGSEDHCQETPENGILIQTPEGVATVDLWINEVKIRLGSTAFIQARPNESMIIRLVEGATEVEALGVNQVALAGSEISIPMNAQLQPEAPPSVPQAYTAASVNNIPVAALERPIQIAPPLDANTLNGLLDTPAAATTVPATALPSQTATRAQTATIAPSATAAITTAPSLTPTVPTSTNTPSPTNSAVPASPTAALPTMTNTSTSTSVPTAATPANTAQPQPSPTIDETPSGQTFGVTVPAATATPIPPTSPPTTAPTATPES